MKIKLKFNTSATTTQEPHTIIVKTQLALLDKKYTLESVTDRSISFKDAPLNFQANLSIRMFDEGEFVISDTPDTEKLLTLNYRYNLLPIILICIFLSIFLKYEGEEWGIAAMLVFYAIAIPIDIKNSKRKAGDMVTAIAG
jgi:hypothetical protein